MRILCVCLSATIQRTIQFDSFSSAAVNRSKTWREDASGKALNAARVLNQLEAGCSVVLCPVGNSNAERFMLLASNDSDLYVTPIYVEGNTRECWTLIDKNNKSTTEIIADEAEDLTHIAGAEAELKLLEFVRKYMISFDALLLAGSRPAIWSKNICTRICEVAHKANKTILVDFRGQDLKDLLNHCLPGIIKVNREEYCQTFSNKNLSDDELCNSIIEESKKLQTILVVTQGEKETLAAEKGKLIKVPVEKVQAVNTTACGDAFDAGFLHSYILNKDVEAAVKAGNHCGALNAKSIVPGSII